MKCGECFFYADQRCESCTFLEIECGHDDECHDPQAAIRELRAAISELGGGLSEEEKARVESITQIATDTTGFLLDLVKRQAGMEG